MRSWTAPAPQWTLAALAITAGALGGACDQTAAFSSGGADLQPPADAAVAVTPDAGGPPTTCASGVQDGSETDVDCGGGACPACADGQTCVIDADCQGGACSHGRCGPAPPCENGVKDGLETDTDCGGPTCEYCAAGAGCRGDDDCASGLCGRGRCAMAQAPLPITFDRRVTLDLPPGITLRVVVADLDGDGHLDLAAPSDGFPITTFRGRGDGTFAPGRTLDGDGASDLAVGDIDGDGRLDLVDLCNRVSGVGVRLGRPGGAFASTVVTRTPPTLASTIAVADIDGDGKGDVFVPGSGDRSLVLHGGAKGGLRLVQLAADPLSAAAGILLVDVDRDGRVDALLASTLALGVALNDRMGGFAAAAGFPWFGQGGASGSTLAAHDFRRRHLLDVVDSDGSVFSGNGNGTFAAPTSFHSGADDAFGIAMADLDRDGNVDLAIGERSSSAVHLVPGTGAARFGAAYTIEGATSAAAIAAGDFNEDSLPDLAIVDFRAARIVVLLNSTR